MIKKWKLGIIGAGGISEHHLEAIRGEPRVQVTAIADVSYELATMRAKRHDIKEVYGDHWSMLERADMDAVIICVPNYLHDRVAIDAMHFGKHVLCEKPMATTPKQAEAMCEAAKASDTVLMIAQNNRFRGESLLIKELVEEGTLGHIYHAKTGWMRRNGIPGWGSWFTQKEMSGGGPLIDLGVHMLDLTLYLMGYPAPVSVFGQTYAEFGPHKKGLSTWGAIQPQGTFDVEDMATALIKCANGATLTLDVSWAAHMEKERAFVHLYGTKASVVLELFDQPTLTLYHEVAGRLANTQLMPEPQKERALLLQNFVDAMEGISLPICTPEQGHYITHILDAIYRSSQTGEMISVHVPTHINGGED